MSIKYWYTENARLLNETPSLRLFQFPLILVHFLTAVFFWQQDFVSILSRSEQRLCWPYLDGCANFFSFSENGALVVFVMYVLTILLGFHLFFTSSRHSLTVLIVLQVMKLLIQSIDYRFMGNYHFMPHVITLVYLLASNKELWMKLWVATFYWSAASLKGNVEWLTGSSLSWKIPFGQPALLPYLALAVVFLEINVPFLLFSSRTAVRYAGLFFLAVFHLVSFYWVGFFYPTVMFSLLSVYLIFPGTPSINWKGLFKTRIAFAFWFIFCVNQLRNVWDHKSLSLDGYSRLYSLNMFDATAECMGGFIAKRGDDWEHIPFVNTFLAVRIRCDNVILLQQARNLCRDYKTQKFQLDAFLYSRLLSDVQQTTIVNKENICENL